MDFWSHLIFHLPSIVLDNEGVLFSLRFLVERILFVNVVELVQKIFVTATRKAKKTRFSCSCFSQSIDYSLARIVEDAQQSRGLRLEEVQAAGVIEEFDISPFNALAFVFFLFVFEDVLKESSARLVNC